MFYPKYKTFDEVIGQSLTTIEQWAFEANLRLCDGCMQDAIRLLEIVFQQDCLEGVRSRDFFSSFDMSCVNSPELRESPAPDATEGSHIGEKIQYLRRAAILKTIEVYSGDRKKALKILGIDDRLCNRLLYEADVEDVMYNDEMAESLQYLPLTAEAFEEALREYDPQRDGDWFDPSKVAVLKVYDRLTVEAAAMVVESGLNIQLEWCHKLDMNVAEVLSGHRGGLSIGLETWDIAVAKCLGQITGELHVEDLDLRLNPHEDWECRIDEGWFTNLIEKFVDQGTTDYPFIRHLTEKQASLFGKLKASRLVLPSLEDTWEPGDGTCEEPENYFMSFGGKQVLILWEGVMHDGCGYELHNWNGEIVTNARRVGLDGPFVNSVRLATLWNSVHGLWLLHEDLEIDEEALASLCNVRGTLFVSKPPALNAELVGHLNQRNYVTIFDDLSDEDEDLIRSSDRILSLSEGWGDRPAFNPKLN